MKGVMCVMAVMAASALAKPQWHELDGYSYGAYVQDFQKVHSEERRVLFEAKLREVQDFNRNSGASYKKGINHMSDWTAEEFKRVSSGIRRTGAEPTGMPLPDWIKNAPLDQLPSHVDWRDRGVVTAVKNQGHCGSCWTFGSTETLESHLAMTTGRLLNLSPQQLVSCAENPGKCGGYGGCEGSTAEQAFEYVKNHGMAEEYTYGYGADTWLGKSNGTCIDDQVPKVVNITGFYKVDANDAEMLARAIALAGPQSISVQANIWGDYESGVFDGCDFAKDIDIDHAVQLVGYTPDAWIVRNSWSPTWGEDGYIRLKRYTPGQTPCGTDTTPQDGDGCPNGPGTEKVCGMCGVAYDAVYPAGVKAL